MNTTYLLIAAAAVAGFVISIYNRLVKLKVKVDEGWADIETQLKRRFNLIPNLVETVKGYAKHEKGTFEQVTALRNQAMNAKTPAKIAEADNMLKDTLKSIFALAENYPELKANQNFVELQNSLEEIEENIQKSRRYYNATVRDYNTAIQVFPNNLLAGMFNFTKRDFFEIENSVERQNVEVKF